MSFKPRAVWRGAFFYAMKKRRTANGPVVRIRGGAPRISMRWLRVYSELARAGAPYSAVVALLEEAEARDRALERALNGGTRDV